MNDVYAKTDRQLRLLAFQAIRKELGAAGLIRFIQYYEQGSGNYTHDRQQWQQCYTVDSLTQAMREKGLL